MRALYLSVISLILLDNQPVLAADHAYCDTYVRHALEQFQVAKGEGCENLNYPVWSMDYKHHYDWCRTVPQATAEQGNQQRVDVLRECRPQGAVTGTLPAEDMRVFAKTPRQIACQGYASDAVAQQQRNLEGNCGFSGPQWNGKADDHYDWCIRGENSLRINDERQRREADLVKCSPSPSHAKPGVQSVPPFLIGEPPATEATGASDTPTAGHAFCETYARDALDQFQVAKGEGCKDLNPPVWSMDFKHHYDWCRKVPQATAEKGNEQRVDVLRACRGQGVITGTVPMTDPTDLVKSTHQANCRDYASKAAAQQQRNKKGNCGVQGPRWNGNPDDHYKWCMRGANHQRADDELSRREEDLAGCSAQSQAMPLPIPGQTIDPRVGGQPPQVKPLPIPQPTIDPGLGGKTGKIEKIVPASEVSPLALERSERVRAFDGKWPAVAKRYLSRLNDDIQAAAASQRMRQQQKLYADFTNPELPQLGFHKSIQMVKQETRELKFASPALAQEQKITSIKGLPNPKFLEEGGAVIISGVHLGKDSGKVYLQYEEALTETEIFQKRSSRKHLVELGPYRIQQGRSAAPSGWGDNWTDNFIIAQMPDVLPGKRLYHGVDGRDAQLIIEGYGKGYILTQGVKIRPVGPQVTKIETSSGMTEFGGRTTEKQWYHSDGREHMFIIGKRFGDSLHHWVRPGDDIFIYGSGFSQHPGKVELKFVEKVSGKWQIPLQPGSQHWWQKDRIHLKVGQLAGDHKMHFADLHIRGSNGREWLGSPFVFGPRTTVKIVSGEKWLQFDRKESKDFFKPDPDGGVLLVSHHPGCGVSLGFFRTGSGESGNDRFFVKKPLPEHVELVGIDYKQLDPDNLESGLSQFASRMKKAALTFLASGALSAFKTVAGQGTEMFVEGLFGGGGYYASVYPPKGDGAALSVRWANMCAGEYVDVPLNYLVSFTLQGPEDILNKL
ncbi:MAG: hypothetical protein ACH255_13545 [Candidatus Thiodiazotropha sp.]